MTSKVSIRIDNVSPLIQYDGDWRTGSVTADPYHNEYSDGGTFTVTQSNAASATINFNGTGISVYGAKRSNHNFYNVSLDRITTRLDGQSKDSETFRQTLFSATSLTNGPHTLVIRDDSNTKDLRQSYFDIDWVVIDTVVDGANSVHVEHTDSAFEYDGQWTTLPPQVGDFSQQNGHSTVDEDASVTFRFTGSAVDIRGLVCSSCGDYYVALDGGPRVTYSAYNDFWTKPQTLLYMARGLSEGAHEVTLTNLGRGQTPGAMRLSVGFAFVYGTDPAGIPSNRSSATASAQTHNTSSTSQNKDDASSTSGVPVGAVVGAVLGGLSLVVLGLALILHLLRKRRHLETRLSQPYIISVMGMESGPVYLQTHPTFVHAHVAPTVHPFPLAPPSESYPATTSLSSGETASEVLPRYSPGAAHESRRDKG
ncbi:hypothetical protein AURDEDRAFT_185960 [Auricularia subglabra TFB-10046 SS5]|nr:hypothetical protein AURDEDRAFT_185960 [Auricularia subglabra TFB-10046 SS5]